MSSVLPEGFTCLKVPGYHTTGGFGTAEFPVQKTFDACDLTPESLKSMVRDERKFDVGHEYTSSVTVNAGATLNLGDYGIPFLDGISVTAAVDRSVDISIKIWLRQSHLERLVNVDHAFTHSPEADAACRASLCDADTLVSGEVFAAAPEIVLESASDFKVSAGGSFYKVVKTHGAVEKHRTTLHTLVASEPLVLASHQAQAEKFTGSLCAPKWSCVQPSVELAADCEKGKLGDKTEGRKLVMSFGAHEVGAYSGHRDRLDRSS